LYQLVIMYKLNEVIYLVILCIIADRLSIIPLGGGVAKLHPFLARRKVFIIFEFTSSILIPTILLLSSQSGNNWANKLQIIPSILLQGLSIFVDTVSGTPDFVFHM